MGVLYLSAMYKRHGHETFAVENDISKMEDKIKTLAPDILAVSVLTPSFPYLIENIKKIKSRFDIPTVFGGPHVTYFPEEILNTLSIGALGLHGSADMLPKGRGRSPMNWSLIEGKKRFL